MMHLVFLLLCGMVGNAFPGEPNVVPGSSVFDELYPSVLHL